MCVAFHIQLVVVFNVTLVIWVLFALKSCTEAVGCGDVIKQEKLRRKKKTIFFFSRSGHIAQACVYINV